MTVSATVKMSISAKKLISGDLNSGRIQAAIEALKAFTDGAGIDQVNQIFADTRTLAASATEDLDVATGGGLVDVAGVAVALARAKAIAIIADPANTNNVRLSRSAANGVPIFGAAGDYVDIGPGDCFLLTRKSAAGIVVTAATGDLITITNSGGTTGVTYSILILGSTT